MTADAESQKVANIEGTRHAVELAEEIEAGCFHIVSSIAAAGLYKGTWREDMFEEAEDLDTHPYFRTKHESERVVREECDVPWRVYRPGIVVGHSETGEMDKVDGPYYFFKLIQRLRNAMPQWMPTIGVEGKEINLVPVDFVAAAMDHIAHQPGLDGQAFHLTDPNPKSAGQVINLFAGAAHAPKMQMRLDPKMFDDHPAGRAQRADDAAAGQADPQHGPRATSGSRESVLTYVNYPTRFDSRRDPGGARGHRTSAFPPLEAYADKLWDYWERNLDPDLFKDRSLARRDRRQDRDDHRRLVGHRQGGRDQGRRGRSDVAARRPHAGEARGDEERDRGGGRRGATSTAATSPTSRTSTGWPTEVLEQHGQRRHPRQQRRPLDPPLGEALLRPLPRLRADDAAQLLRRR